jgi:hypothetical protein
MSSEPSGTVPPVKRWLFVVTILTGSFLLFLVQPLVARMALPRLGGAPNVWNSAMLVYQALLLAGYFYAHRLSKMPFRRQVKIHVALLGLAAVTLPIALVSLPAPPPGTEVLWVPLLLVLTIGPVFFLVSAQAPLMQRWFGAHPDAGEPWALYAASNIGSFAGLIAYPLVAEPLFSTRAQSWGWTLGYGLLIGLIVLAARARWKLVEGAAEQTAPPAPPIPTKRILLWMALAAVPSGLMLSTTTHLTTDIFAMPLLWVIPLGLYLLSFAFAFSDRRGAARLFTAATPTVILLAGGLAMGNANYAGLTLAFASVAMLFLVCIALHSRLYDLRPDPSQLTTFYLVMSAGGVIGGAFPALIAPVLFDWVWEHPLLVLAAALLIPIDTRLDWRRLPGLSHEMVLAVKVALVLFTAFLLWLLIEKYAYPATGTTRGLLVGGVVLCGFLLAAWRPLFLAVLAGLMLAQGGFETIETGREGLRTRSYFGVYTVRDYPDQKLRTLAHGTTLHGEQSLDPKLAQVPLTYYGPGSGAGMVFGNARQLFGPHARIGVVGLGTGTLACYYQRGETWRFFEIDPAVLKLSQNGKFTYMRDCAPTAQTVIGDARLELARYRAGSFDLIAIDAFSSDAIPLHLLTDEAFGVYEQALDPRGVLLVHISNRYIELEPVVAALAKRRGLAVAIRDDNPGEGLFTPSSWVILARNPARLAEIGALDPALKLRPLLPPAPRVWTDDYASILPYVRWQNLVRTRSR